MQRLDSVRSILTSYAASWRRMPSAWRCAMTSPPSVPLHDEVTARRRATSKFSQPTSCPADWWIWRKLRHARTLHVLTANLERTPLPFGRAKRIQLHASGTGPLLHHFVTLRMTSRRCERLKRPRLVALDACNHMLVGKALNYFLAFGIKHSGAYIHALNKNFLITIIEGNLCTSFILEFVLELFASSINVNFTQLCVKFLSRTLLCHRKHKCFKASPRAFEMVNHQLFCIIASH